MIFLMRHGADAPDRYGGWSNWGLTDDGKRQVCAAKLQLLNKGITEIYSSDLARAKETAQLVAEYLCLPVIYLPEFREANNGYLAGMLKEEAARKYPGKYWSSLEWTEPWPGGESPQMFYQRIKTSLDKGIQGKEAKKVLPTLHKTPPNGTIGGVFVCGGNP